METFVSAFNATQARAHRINVLNGWWADRRRMMELLRSSGEFSISALNAFLGIHLIGLIHTEPSEAVEALRKPVNPIDSTEPHSVGRELAGTIVRMMDMAEEMGIPLGECIELELQRNEKRARMHGNNVA